jgi:4-alpha-glucanotransferase
VSLIPDNEFRQEPGPVNWDDTRIILPDTAPDRWWSITENKELHFSENIYLSDLMNITSPILIKGKKSIPNRFAGVLAHVTSLPGKFGTGDLGPEAYKFVDFLKESGQSFWQILPFNPTSESYSWSPYSSSSAFAGNLMFLSPDILLEHRLISIEHINEKFRESDNADFSKSIKFRSNLLKDAFKKFNDSSWPFQKKEFDDFCQSENFWLNDYALFVTLKKQLRGKPWDKWPADIRNRKKKTLSDLFLTYRIEIEKEKFGQYLFQKQWAALKKYSNNKGIRLIGDVSFYVNYDSAEVWAHPENFKLNSEKKPTSVSGVPPDYFSSDGQLWNMPVYNWDKMKKEGYQWWISRIKRNLELCDIIRFDHFRGFSAYWEIPAGEATARNGKWTEGPGNSFFEHIKNEFPDMPFIAEDLGQIDDKVIKLRDDFHLPGMAVLQFAFGDSTPSSSYTPQNHIYNSIVYTGTHDNNTTRGWYSEISDKNRKEAEEYVGHKIHNEFSNDEFIRMAYSSVARIAIIPVQDILGLDVNARLNEPSTIDKNWVWKLRKTDLKKDLQRKLRRMAILFGRI